MIPKVFHRVWFGGPMPDEYARYGETWQQHHPEWELRLWSEGDLPEIEAHPNFRRVKSHSERSDFYRHAILAAHGGVYLDTDFECLRSIDPLLQGVDAFAASENNRHISCGILGAVPGHPFYVTIRDTLLAPSWKPRGNASKNTGPCFVTDIADLYRLRDTLKVFPPELFYPVAYRETYTGNPADYPAAYAIHHWAASWLPPSQRPKS